MKMRCPVVSLFDRMVYPVLFVLFLLGVSQGQEIDPAAYRRAIESGDITPSQMDELMQEYRARKGRSPSGLAEEMESRLEDEKARREEDTLEKASEEKGTEEASRDMESSSESTYQKMLRGEPVHPDELIPGLKRFGHRVFSDAGSSTFVPAQGMAVPSEYILGTGDEINVMLWGRINEEYDLKVGREGKINIPRIGPVAVAGLPFSAMERNIHSQLSNIEGVEASVSVGKLRSIGVFVVGEVANPGLYTVSALSNVTNVLFAAGGPTHRGSLRQVQLKRNGRLIATIDYYDFLLKGIDRSKYKLRSGDVVLVPVARKMAAIAGNVRRSAIYEVLPKTTLGDLVDLAGGFTPTAWTTRLQVKRYVDNEFQTVLDLDSVTESLPSFGIEDGDIVKVFPVVVQNQDAVYLEGNVVRPGTYQLKEGMRVSDLIGGYGGLRPECYFQYAVIMRREAPSYVGSVIPFNLKDALNSPGGNHDIALQSQDRVVIYHRDFFEPDRSVMVEGAVTSGGKYKLLEDMTIRDLILQAGGLGEDASTFRGELYRRNLEDEIVRTEKIDFCVACAMEDDPAHNLELRRFDRVYVRSKRGWQEEKTVRLKGEVVYPGRYVLLGDETLGQLIERAGGFTEDAYLAAALLTRPSVKRLEQERIDEYAQQLEREIMQATAAMAAEEDAQEVQQIIDQQKMLLQELRSSKPVGRVVIDLTSRNSYEDFLLEDGDALLVPETKYTVSVIGEVYNPATFRHDPDEASVRNYVERSGGLKPSAEKKDIYVIRANGSILTRKMARVQRAKLKPGDVVVVPQKLETGKAYRRFSQTLDTIVRVLTITSLSTSTVLGVQALQ